MKVFHLHAPKAPAQVSRLLEGQKPKFSKAPLNPKPQHLNPETLDPKPLNPPRPKTPKLKGLGFRV